MTETAKRPLPIAADGHNALDVALEATAAAGEIIRRGWHSDRQITFKGRADIVTDIDLAAEKAMLEILTGAFPRLRHPRRGIAPRTRRIPLPLGGGPP